MTGGEFLKDEDRAYSPENILSKSNVIINSKYQASLNAQKILYIAMYKLQHNEIDTDPDTGSPCILMYPTEIIKLLGCSSSSIYSSLDNIARQIINTPLGTTDHENQRFEYVQLITYASYENGIFKVVFNNKFDKYLIDLKGHYTQLPRHIMMDWKGKYTIRLYEILKQYTYYASDYKGERNGIFKKKFDVYELRFLLGVIDANTSEVKGILEGKNPDYRLAYEKTSMKKNASWRDFKRHVLDSSVNEINNSSISDISVRMNFLKKARNEVYSVEFLIYDRNLYKPEKEDIEISPIQISDEEKFLVQAEILRLLSPMGIKLKDVPAISEAAGYDIEKIEQAVKYIKETEGKIRNLPGFLISYFKNGGYEKVSYKSKSSKKDSFSNFEERDVDYDSLLKQLGSAK